MAIAPLDLRRAAPVLVTGEQASAAATPPARRTSWRRVVAAGLVLLVAYFGLSLLNSPRGYLGTDTGGKVATLRAMDQHHTLTDVDVGYWAQRWDPDGTYHPLWYTNHDASEWLQVTTLPMVLAAAPLYQLGGIRLALLLPMLGAAAAAFAARSLSRRFGASERAGWWAFWLVGLASPVTIYALDLWEHTLGLALMAWGVVAAIDLIDRKGRGRREYWVLGALAGVAFGAAASMRTESLLYGTVFVGAAVLVLAARRQVWDALCAGVAAATGLVALVAANVGLETLILGHQLRGSRAAGTVAGAGGGFTERLREGLVTTFGSAASFGLSDTLTGVALVGVIWLVVWTRRRRDVSLQARAAMWVMLGLLVALVVGQGYGFVPGLFVTTPLAALGVWSARDRSATAVRIAVVAALAALPLVWWFQWTGGALPQWAGRYVLCSGFVLLVAAVPALERLPVRPRLGLVACGVAVTVFGLGWVSVRTHRVGRDVPRIEAQQEQVLIADQSLGHLWREGGAFYGERKELTVGVGGDIDGAARVAAESGAETIGFVHTGTQAPQRIGAYRHTGRVRLSFLGAPVYVDRYVQR